MTVCSKSCTALGSEFTAIELGFIVVIRSFLAIGKQIINGKFDVISAQIARRRVKQIDFKQAIAILTTIYFDQTLRCARDIKRWGWVIFLSTRKQTDEQSNEKR